MILPEQLGGEDHHLRHGVLGVDGRAGQHHRGVVVGMLDAVGEHDAAAHAVAQHDPLQPGVVGGGDADQGVEVVGVFGDVAQVDPLAAGTAVTAMVQRIGDEAGLTEPLRDVVVATGVLGVSVRQHDDPLRLDIGCPYVVDDAHAADTVEAAFLAGSGHQGRVASACRSVCVSSAT